jgi:hypothetical protein
MELLLGTQPRSLSYFYSAGHCFGFKEKVKLNYFSFLSFYLIIADLIKFKIL